MLSLKSPISSSASGFCPYALSCVQLNIFVPVCGGGRTYLRYWRRMGVGKDTCII